MNHGSKVILPKFRKVSIGLVGVLVFMSLLFPDTLEARKFKGLRVHGDHRLLEPIVGAIPKNRSGVTTEDVKYRVMRKLLSIGIQPTRSPQSYHFLDVDVVILSKGTSFSVVVSLKKMAQAYGFDPKVVGPVVTMAQGEYGLFGNAAKDKDYVLEAVDEVMDKFLLDYRDSNLN